VTGAELTALLRETDIRRPLDSLETVVVLTYLRERAVSVPESPGERPDTIEGWLAWVERHSPAS
jgi:hypothetical protein